MRNFFLGLLFIIAACHTVETDMPVGSVNAFFDLDKFYKEEINRLANKVIALNKTATINEQSEVQQIDSFDLKKELEFLAAADINKIAWLDQYRVDSIWQNNHLQSISYTALNDNLKTKQLMITFGKKGVSHIQIQKKIANMAIESNQLFTYYTGKGYEIRKDQSLVLSDAKKVSLEVDYVFEK